MNFEWLKIVKSKILKKIWKKIILVYMNFMPKILIAFLIFLSSISLSYSQNVEVFKFTDEELSNLKVRKVRGAKNMTE